MKLKTGLIALSIAAFSMTATADIYLDGFMSDQDLQWYQEDVDAGYDMNGLYEYDGDYYDTLIDTTVNMNTNVLFETYQSTTMYTNAGAKTVYQTGASQSTLDVLAHFQANNIKDFGFNAKVLVGNVSLSNGGSNKVTFTELANGKYESSERYNYGGKPMVYSYDDVMFRIDNKLLDESYETTKFGTKVKTEWKGITTEEIYNLNKDHFEYTVKAGEGLWSVVFNSGTDLTYEEIYELNPGLKERGYLRLGEVLQVRSEFEEGYHVNIKDWSQTDIDNKTDKALIIDENEYMKARYAEGSGEFMGYTVQSGQGLWSVSNGLGGVSYDDLYAANDGLEGRYLRTGEVLYKDTVTFVESNKVISNVTDLAGANLFNKIPEVQLNTMQSVDTNGINVIGLQDAYIPKIIGVK